MKIGDKIKLKLPKYYESAPYVRAGATGTLLKTNNVFSRVFLDQEFQQDYISIYDAKTKLKLDEITVFSSDIEVFIENNEK